MTAHILAKESACLRSLVSDQRQQLGNVTFFIDADPDLFAYVLRYLRHGIYPVCFNPESGHDYATYMGIRQLAEQFGIGNLARWLADRQYESAIECSVSSQPVLVGAASASYPSTEQVWHVGTPDHFNRVSVFKRKFTPREDVFLIQNRGSA